MILVTGDDRPVYSLLITSPLEFSLRSAVSCLCGLYVGFSRLGYHKGPDRNEILWPHSPDSPLGLMSGSLPWSWVPWLAHHPSFTCLVSLPLQHLESSWSPPGASASSQAAPTPSAPFVRTVCPQLPFAHAVTGYLSLHLRSQGLRLPSRSGGERSFIILFLFPEKAGLLS